MALQTLVKAGTITNLTNARYCAGMGVEIIGFPVGKSNPSALEATKIKEIMGWLAGVKMAVEFDEAIVDEQYTAELIDFLKPDFIQLPLHLQSSYREITSLPFILQTDSIKDCAVRTTDFILYTGTIDENRTNLIEYCQLNAIILSNKAIDTASVLSIVTSIKPFGVELKGGIESSPGLKSLDELADILELLEIEE